MATYKNLPILENSDTVAKVPTYTTDLVEAMETLQDEITLTLNSPFTGGGITLRRYGNEVHMNISTSRQSGSGVTTVATIPTGWRPGYNIEFHITTYATGGGISNYIRVLTTGAITCQSRTASTDALRSMAPIIWKIGN